MLDKLYDKSTSILEKALDGTWLRNEAISQNIANADTPGYKRKTVSFEEELSKAVEGQEDPADIEPQVTQDNDTYSYRLDGNNVDIEKEMSDLAKNTIQYSTLEMSLNAEFKRLRMAISEGRS